MKDQTLMFLVFVTFLTWCTATLRVESIDVRTTDVKDSMYKIKESMQVTDADLLIASSTPKSEIQCSVRCHSTDNCTCFGFNSQTSNCELYQWCIASVAPDNKEKSVGFDLQYYLDSCSAWRQIGYVNNDNYVIDLDGPGGFPAFSVYCNMSSDPPVTLIGHDKETRYHVNGYANFLVNVTYVLPLDTILYVMNQSSECKQYMRYECHHAVINHGGQRYSWWVSRSGEKMAYWGGGPSDGEGCTCKLTDSCTTAGALCHCDTNDNVWREDDGYVTDMNKLPVAQMNFGDTESSNESGYYTLGPLECTLNNDLEN